MQAFHRNSRPIRVMEAIEMHPIVSDFCERKPRLYDLLAMVVALGVAWLGQLGPEPLFAFFCLCYRPRSR